VFGIAPNMDEFSSYQPIACRLYPHGAENVFREGCDNYLLKVFGHWLPLRSYGYVGSGQAMRYLPFFLLWRDFYSARLIDFSALVAIYYVIRRTTGVSRWTGAALIFLCFPVVFQTAVDTGPISFDFAMALVIPFLIARTRKFSVAALAGFLLFVGFWDKPNFLVSVPSMVGLGLLFRRKSAADPIFPPLGRREFGILMTAAAVFAAFAFLLLSAETREGLTLFATFRENAVQRTLLEQWDRLRYWAPFARSFLNFTDKLFDKTEAWDFATIAYWILTWGAVIGAWVLRGFGRRTLLVSVPLGLAVFCFFLLNRTGATWAGHHLIFVFPFLLVGFAEAFGIVEEQWPKFVRWAPIPLALVGGYLAADRLTTAPQLHSDWDRVELNRVLSKPDIARKYVMVVVDWGMYYYQSLYGDPEQLVLYLEPFIEPWKVDAVREVAKRNGRRVLFIIRRSTVSDFNLIRRSFPGLQSIPYPIPNGLAQEWFAIGEL
jgi:hypothetical protein